MRKFAWLFSSLLLIVAAMMLAVVTSSPVVAIGEVTPTPEPDAPTEEPAQESDVDVEALVDEGLIDIQNGEYRSALAKMDIVIEVDPTNTTAYLIRGVSNNQLGFAEDALADFTTAIELEPWQFDYYLFRGDIHIIENSLTDALLDYDQAIRINPLSIEAFLRRSNTNYELGDSVAGDVDDLIARGLQALSNGDTASALSFLDEAIATGEGLESTGNAYYIRAFTNRNAGDTEASFEDYASALEVNEELHIVHLARGIQYREEGDIQAAGEDFLQRMTIHRGETTTDQMAIGETLQVEIAYRRVVEISFEGQAGQVISISAEDFGDTVVDPLIALLDSDGNPIAGDDDFGGGLNSLIDEFELPADGTYTVLVGHAEGGYNFGFNGTVEVEIVEE